jgi:hypothetical protein
VVPVLHLPADVLEVALPKERDEQIANRVVGRGTMPLILRACALVVVAVLVAAGDAVVVLAAGAVAGSPCDDRPCVRVTVRPKRRAIDVLVPVVLNLAHSHTHHSCVSSVCMVYTELSTHYTTAVCSFSRYGRTRVDTAVRVLQL